MGSEGGLSIGSSLSKFKSALENGCPFRAPVTAYFQTESERLLAPSLSLSFFFFLAILQGLGDLKFPDQGLNPCPLKWKHRVLTTGPPGKSL